MTDGLPLRGRTARARPSACLTTGWTLIGTASTRSVHGNSRIAAVSHSVPTLRNASIWTATSPTTTRSRGSVRRIGVCPDGPASSESPSQGALAGWRQNTPPRASDAVPRAGAEVLALGHRGRQRTVVHARLSAHSDRCRSAPGLRPVLAALLSACNAWLEVYTCGYHRGRRLPSCSLSSSRARPSSGVPPPISWTHWCAKSLCHWMLVRFQVQSRAALPARMPGTWPPCWPVMPASE